MLRLFYKLLVIIVITFPLILFSQEPTVGLLYTTHNESNGYTLFSPERNTKVYLINNCGEKVNEWNFSENPSATCYLLEDGTLLRAGKDSLEIRDWDNNLIWSYAMDANGYSQHHDIEPLPNGNILCLLRDVIADTTIINQGRNPALVDNNIKLDRVIELEPVGTNNANLVWEWKFIDHFIQDYDNSKPNYGTIVDHPELIDLNFDNGFNEDWTHCNAIDYNANLDQVMLSSRHLNELYIIDHSTTTAEAASHSGGNFNMGGDILWRWGNPQVYQQGDITEQKLFMQHDGKWVNDGYADENKISVFSNREGGNTYSSVHIIKPQIANNTYLKDNEKFIPLAPEWSWSGSILGNTMYESKKSGVQSLQNGNMLICESGKGQITEIDKNGNVLWVYKNPVASSIINQYSTPIDNSIFRAEKYSTNYIGFVGKDVSTNGLIENANLISDTCTITTKIDLFQIKNSIKAINPVQNSTINFNTTVELDKLDIINLNGKTVYSKNQFIGSTLSINLNPGLYILQMYANNKLTQQKIIVE